MTKLFAYLHTTKSSGRVHLRVRQPGGYSDALREAFRRVGTPAHWAPADDPWAWDYPLTAAAVTTLQRVAAEHSCEIEYAPDLKEFAEEQARNTEYEKTVRLSLEKHIANPALPLPVYQTTPEPPPMHHQQVSYHWGTRVPGLFLAWDPGLGKTRAGCDLLGGWYRNAIIRPMQQVWLPEQKRWGVRGGVLIITPKQMLRTWCIELQKWQGALGLELAGGSAKKKRERAGMIAHAHVVNHESLHLVEGNEYDAIISDEHHRCANASGFTEKTLALARHARRRVALSGTPVTGNLESVFYQMLIVDDGRSLGASKTAFLERWFSSEMVGPGITENRPRPGAVEAVAKAMSHCTYFLKKEECLDLPEKTHTPLILEMSPEQRRYYDKLKSETLAYIEDSTVTVEQAASRMMKLRQVCQGFVLDDVGIPHAFNASKLEVLLEMLQGKLAGRKVVVWAPFSYEIDRLCERLVAAGIGYVRMDGQVTSKKHRDEALRLWNTMPEVRVFVGQIQIGVGITLHANECLVPCADCVYLGLDYSYVNWKQSQDRIHRIGQKYHCAYTYLLSEDGVDANIYQSLLNKQATAGAVHRQGKDFFRSLLTGEEPALAAVD